MPQRRKNTEDVTEKSSDKIPCHPEFESEISILIKPFIFKKSRDLQKAHEII